MSISDPDIQEAPVYPVLFEIKQEQHVVQMINPTKNFTIRFSIYVPYILREEIKKHSYYIYVTLSNNEIPIAQKIAPVNPPQDQKVRILQFASQFDPINLTNNDSINVQVAITAKHHDEMGIGEALRVNRFINTYIPLENHYE